VPLYDFRCDACGQSFEELVLGAEAVVCSHCGSDRIVRLISQVSPMPKIGLRGAAAKKSDTFRANREEQRREGFAKDSEARKKG
jgi:putative FmdB family regulatory protein